MKNTELQKIVVQNTKIDYGNLQRLLATGNALLFTGAGFSLESKNIDGENIPSAKELAKIISNEFLKNMEKSIDENLANQIKCCDDLMIISDFYLKKIGERNSLLQILKRKFTIQEPTSAQKEICGHKWRRIYTTNYDNSIELARLTISKTTTSLDLTDNPTNFKKQDDICLHINGKIESSNETDLEKKIKLTTSSYLSPDQFIHSAWYSQFKTDIDHCSAIIFVGYSMYDLDIQKILFDNQEIKDKTFFITKEGNSLLDDYKLSLFGKILNIGVNGFADIIKKIDITNNITNETINSLELYNISDEYHNIRDLEISNFMLFGNISDNYIDQLTLTNTFDRKLIYRNELEKIKQYILAGNDILITSDLGNGKSILLKVLVSSLTRSGYRCYVYLDNEFSFTKDLESISKNNNKNIIFIDDYNNKIDNTKYAIANKYDNIQLVLSARFFGYEHTKEQLSVMNLSNFKFFNLDQLSDNEINQFIKIVDGLGQWGDKAGETKKDKLSGLDYEAKSQLSLLLLSVLKSNVIGMKIKEIIEPILNNSHYKDTIFAILLLDIMGESINRSIISDIAMNEEIYNQNFISSHSVQNLFKIEKGIIKSKSSTLSIYLISNQFNSKYVVNQLLKIVGHLDCINKDTRDKKWQSIITSLFRFSTIEKILPQKRTEINLYYEKLKEAIPRLITEPHFWVQYAMSVITFRDYDRASIYLETAYSLAEKRNDYHTNNINTQQARLYFLISLTKVGKESFELFEKGNNLLKTTPNDIFKLRQLKIYRTIYEKAYKSFNTKQKVFFEHALKMIVREFNNSESFENNTYGHISAIPSNSIITDLSNIIKDIENNRK